MMLTVNQNCSYPLSSVLFTFALDAEAADVFPAYNPLICGIGKVNATYHLLKAIGERRPSLIVALLEVIISHRERLSAVPILYNEIWMLGAWVIGSMRRHCQGCLPSLNMVCVWMAFHGPSAEPVTTSKWLMRQQATM